MIKKTPLYEQHVAAGGKMVDFAGWDMPLHYGSQLDEHHQVRRDAGLFDVSHMSIIDITGENTLSLLQVLMANNVAKLKVDGKALYTCMLNQQGGVIDDLLVYRLAEGQYRTIFNAATRDVALAWVLEHAKAYQVTVEEQENLAMIAVQGPNAIAKTLDALPAQYHNPINDLKLFTFFRNNHWMIARTGYTGEDGLEILLPVQEAVDCWERLLAAGVKPCGLGARDTLRLEAGLNLYGTDMDETTTPLESNLAWTVAWKPEERKFIGRDVLEKQRQEGLKRRLVGLVLQDKGVLRNQQKVIVEGVGEGQITSGGFSPTLKQSIALARVPAEISDNCYVDVRGKKLLAQIVKPPFLKRGES